MYRQIPGRPIVASMEQLGPLGLAVVWDITDAVVDRDKSPVAAVALEFIQESPRLRVHILQGRAGRLP